ncbi:hypothetical protein LCGC14_0338280 [marine sediment metagenome]|uniref:Uncharacterized protein n=1 Tax=marine sediment metagenome TaxID=412755 RepID=A0A0F9TK04_9ZZZZ
MSDKLTVNMYPGRVEDIQKCAHKILDKIEGQEEHPANLYVIDSTRRGLDDLVADWHSLTARNAALREALEFYADSTNHRASWAHSDVPSSAGLGGPSRISSLVERDCGTKARTALERGDE